MPQCGTHVDTRKSNKVSLISVGTELSTKMFFSITEGQSCRAHRVCSANYWKRIPDVHTCLRLVLFGLDLEREREPRKGKPNL